MEVQAQGKAKDSSVSVAEKPKCKACCACPETKQVRDAW